MSSILDYVLFNKVPVIFTHLVGIGIFQVQIYFEVETHSFTTNDSDDQHLWSFSCEYK